MITSTSNAKIKRIVQLRKKKKARDAEGVFLVEGIRMFREIPEKLLQEIYISESRYTDATGDPVRGGSAFLQSGRGC